MNAFDQQQEPLLGLEPTDILTKVFGHNSFRGNQEAVCTSIISGQDTLVLMPTGGGKSLCFQIPGLYFRAQGKGPVIVVSPLIALMRDQVDALKSRGIKAYAWHSELDDEQEAALKQAIVADECDFLYLSPERLKRLYTLGIRYPSLIVIDEAHCIDQWGHDFRPHYLKLGGVLSGYSAAPYLALTGSASPQTFEIIAAALSMRDPVFFQSAVRRPNLKFRVIDKKGSDEQILARLDDLGFRGARGDLLQGKALVYAPSRLRVDSLAKMLNKRGVSCLPYHAGRGDRDATERVFRLGRVPVLVCTSAFGMGVDIADIRAVFHLSPPETIEAYYQQAGRAGRDGSVAVCELFVDPKQKERGHFGFYRKAKTRSSTQNCLGIAQYILAENCRQIEFTRAFLGEVPAAEDEACGVCDQCSAWSPPAYLDLIAEEERSLYEQKVKRGYTRQSESSKRITKTKAFNTNGNAPLEGALTAYRKRRGAVLKLRPSNWLPKAAIRWLIAERPDDVSILHARQWHPELNDCDREELVEIIRRYGQK